MAINTRITIQQMVGVDQDNISAGKYPRFIVNLGTSITGVTIADLTNTIQLTSEYAAAAAQSASDAEVSETNAKTSETNAKTSETNAATSETNADISEAAAKESETNAKTSETNAKTSETNAADSASIAAAAQAAAELAQSEAEASEAAAKASETNAKTSETNAATSETNAADSAAASAQSALESKNSATDSEGSATDATAEADRAKAEADRAEALVDTKLDADDIAPFVKLYKTKALADADVASRVADEVVLVWSETDHSYGWYKVVDTAGVKSLTRTEEEIKMVTVNNIRPDNLGNVQVTIPGGNPSLWLGEVTLFPYDNDAGIGYSGILLADGRELNRADYPDLWIAIESGLIPSVSDTEWTAGSNQFYSTGDGTTTFRIPNLLQGQAFRAATINEDGTEEITPQVPYITTVNGVGPNDTTGAVVLDLNSIIDVVPISQGGTGATTLAAAKTNLGIDRLAQQTSFTYVYSDPANKYRLVLNSNGSWGYYDTAAGAYKGLEVNKGGTGAITAAAARTNLQAAQRSVNNDITELQALATISSEAAFTSSPSVPEPTEDAHAVSKNYVDTKTTANVLWAVETSTETLPANGTTTVGGKLTSQYSANGKVYSDAQLYTTRSAGNSTTNVRLAATSYDPTTGNSAQSFTYNFSSTGIFTASALTTGVLNTNSVEISGATPFIDFHYGSSSADYTHRLIASEPTTLMLTTPTGSAYLAVDGGYKGRAGLSGGFGTNFYNFIWESPSIRAYIDSTNIGLIQMQTASDRLLKKNIIYKDATGAALAEVMNWRVASFNYKARGVIQESETKLGFIANDLVGVSSECVVGEGLKEGFDENNPEGAYGLDQVAMIAKLTLAIQSQQALINKLNDRIELLELKLRLDNVEAQQVTTGGTE